MPSVNLSQETYEKLKQLAAASDCSPEAAAEVAVSREFRERELADEDWQREWDALLAEIRRSIPQELTAEELHTDIDRAVAEARAKRRARSH